MATDVILDTDWVRQANLLPKRVADGPKGLSQISMTVEQLQLRRYTSASFKFTNGTLGGNFALNMPPQPCRFADPVPDRYVVPKIPGGGKPEWGMSRWYSENIDDFSTLLHVRAGIPAYNSLWSFFGNFYNSDDARLIRTGRDWSIGSFIGRALGWVFSIRLLPFIWTGQAIKYFVSVTSTRFAYLKPTMGMYWKYVNDVANTLAANLDMTAEADASYMQLAENFQRRPDSTTEANQTVGAANASATSSNQGTIYQVTEDTIASALDKNVSAVNDNGANKAARSLFVLDDNTKNYYRERLPEIYQSEGLIGINVYAVVLRAQSMADAWNTAVMEKQEAAMQSGQNNQGLIDTIRAWILDGSATQALNQQLNGRSNTIEDFLVTQYFPSRYGGISKAGTADPSTTADPAANPSQQTNEITQQAAKAAAEDPKNETNTSDKTAEASTTAQDSAGLLSTLAQYASDAYESMSTLWDASADNYNSLKKVFKAAQHDGSQFLTLRVNGRDSASESFSNSTRQSDIANMMNSASASARNILVNVADGNLTGLPLVGQIAGFIGDVIGGVASSLKISGVGALMGNAFVDIPEHYDTSQAQFNQMSYTIHLRAPYGNDHSRFQNELLPLACVLALVLPRSAGVASYGMPFHVEAYCRGRGQIRFGIPSEVSITRATANMPWTSDGRFRGIDIRLTFKDLTSVMHMSMNEVSGWRAIDPTRWGNLLFPQDSAFSDYMSVLSSLGLGDQIYRMRKLKRNLKAMEGSFEKWFSPQARAVSVFSGLTGQVLSSFSHGIRN